MLAEASNVSNASVVAALQRASAATGSDFHYLLGTAMRESGLKPGAQSSTSSAAGLFQFVEQTWFGVVKEYGAKHGLGSYANAIEQGADGKLRADNSADRTAILALRNDPQVSALMAGEYAQQTKSAMQCSLGRDVCGGELYAAHFLGADAACKLIQLNGAEPGAAAANAFPQAASANKNVFYHSDGSAKSVREVYNWVTQQPSVETASLPPAKPSAVASSSMSPVMADYSDLLASMWTPSSSGFFPSGGSSPFLLSPGVLDILSSVSPAPKDRNQS